LGCTILAGVRRSAILLATILLTAFVATTVACAHASLGATEPKDGAVIETAPSLYLLTFSEPVSPLSLNLVRPDGSSLRLDHFVLKDRTVEIEAPTQLGRGTHVISWRVVSEDGHPIGGSVLFSVGAPSTQAPVVETAPDWTVRGGLWLSKIALYIGLFIGVGGAFALGVLMPGVLAGRSVVVATLLVGALGASLSVGFQGLDALDAQASRIVEPIIWSTGFGTSYGRTVTAALIALVLAGVSLVSRGVIAKNLAVLALLGGGLALSLSGHASAASPQWLMRPMVLLHATAIAVWVGALAPLGLALKRHEPAASQALHRFSRIIPGIVAALVIAGVVLAVVQVERPGALVDTAYGQVFLVKLILLLGLFTLASVNRWSLTAAAEAGDPSASRRLVRAIAVETLIVILIFAAASAWRFTPPPRALAAAVAMPELLHIHTAKAMADVNITPGRAGPVDAEVTVMTGDFGPLDAKEVSLVFSSAAAGIQPIRRPASSLGNGNWRAENLVLPVAGVWQIRVDILVSDFEIVRLDGEIRLKP
jgi:copper transport protein